MEGFVVPALACVHQSGLTVQGWSHEYSLSSLPPISLRAKSCLRLVAGVEGDRHKGNQQSPSY